MTGNDGWWPSLPGTGGGTTEGGGGARAESRDVDRAGNSSRAPPPCFAWSPSPKGEDRLESTPNQTLPVEAASVGNRQLCAELHDECRTSKKGVGEGDFRRAR